MIVIKKGFFRKIVIPLLVLLASVSYSLNLKANSFEVIKSATVDTIASGQSFQYKLQYRCASTTADCNGVFVIDTLPDNVEYLSAIGTVHTVGTPTYNGTDRTVRFDFIDPLPAGSTGELKITVRFARGSTPNHSAATNVAHGNITNGPNLPSNPVDVVPTAEARWYVRKSGTTTIYLDQDVNYEVSFCTPSNDHIGGLDLDNAVLVDDLPEGAVFVGASDGGVYSASGGRYGNGTVTWNLGNLNVTSNTSCTDRTVTVNFPSSNTANIAGKQITNMVEGFGQPIGEGSSQSFGLDSIVSSLDTISANPSISVDKGGSSRASSSVTKIPVGAEVWYYIKPVNTGNVPLSNFTYIDTLPPHIEFTQLESGGWLNAPVSFTISYQTNNVTSWTAWPNNPYDGTVDLTLPVSELSLPTGEYVTMVKWEFTDPVPAGFTTTGDRPRVNGIVINPDHNGNPVNPGDVFTNCVTSTGVHNGITYTDVDCQDLTIVELLAREDPYKQVLSDGPYFPGDTVVYQIRIENDNSNESFRPLPNPIALDLLPAELNYVDNSWTITGNNSGAPTPLFERLDNYNTTGRTLLRWSWTGAAAYDFPINSSTYISFKVTIDSSITIGTKIENCMYIETNDTITTCDGSSREDINDLDGDGDFTDELCESCNSSSDDIEIAMPELVSDVYKTTLSSGPYLPGGEVEYRLRIDNTSSSTIPLTNPIGLDLLPAEVEYAEGSWQEYTNTAGAPAPIFEKIDNYAGTGRTLLRWSWKDSVAHDFPIDSKYEVRFKIKIKATASGTIYNRGFETVNGMPLECNESMEIDTLDLDGDGSFTDTLCRDNTDASFFVESVAALESEKLVKGQLDSVYSKFPLSGLTVPGGTADYQLYIRNPGNVPMKDIFIIDILPFIGDKGVIDTSDRNTEWRPNLVAPVAAPSGVTVYYSIVKNPCRTDFLASGPVGCEVPNWSTVPPNNLSDVQSIMFDFGATILNPGDELLLEWPMRAPINAPTNGEIAWNSFGYKAVRVDNDEALLPSEPIKVGIEIEPINPAAYGNYVWLDDNLNGLQDEGDTTGVDGVRVELYEDNGDGVSDPTMDRFVTFTLTSDTGYYVFPNLPAGDYYAVFYPPPTYNVTLSNQGSIDTLDSDGRIDTIGGTEVAIMPVTTLVADEFDYTWDLGLYRPSPPVSALGNYVWFDRNADGLQNESTTDGLNNVEVRLYQDVNVNGIPEPSGADGSPIKTILTKNDLNGNPGYYLFDDLVPGFYFVEFVLPTGATFTTQGPGGTSDQVDSDADAVTGLTEVTSLVDYEYDPTWDAGLIMPSGGLSLGNRVWREIAVDGTYDPFNGEQGVNNVKINLYLDSDANGVFTPGVDTYYSTTKTFTKAGVPGYYIFENLAAGDYIVQIDPINFNPFQPLDSLVSTNGNGVAPDPDDDINHDDNGEEMAAYGVVSQAVTLLENTEPDNDGDTDKDSNLSVDFGFMLPQCPDWGLVDRNECVDNFPVVLDAGNGFDTYVWSTSDVGRMITVMMAGDYSVTVTTGSCTMSDTLTLSMNASTPTAVVIDTFTLCDSPAGAMSIDLQTLITSGATSGVWADDDATGSLSGTTCTYDPNMGTGPFHFTYTISGSEGAGSGGCNDRKYTATLVIETCCKPPTCLPVTIQKN